MTERITTCKCKRYACVDKNGGRFRTPKPRFIRANIEQCLTRGAVMSFIGDKLDGVFSRELADFDETDYEDITNYTVNSMGS